MLALAIVVMLVLKASKAFKVSRVIKEFKVIKAFKVNRVIKAFKVIREFRVIKVYKVPMVVCLRQELMLCVLSKTALHKQLLMVQTLL